MATARSRFDRSTPPPKRASKFLGTRIGAGAGVLAICVWMVTFAKEGDVELSRFLFPISAMLLERHYYSAGEAIPPMLRYSGALLHWLLPGIAFDLGRAIRRAARREG
jgi:hypothetical protein